MTPHGNNLSRDRDAAGVCDRFGLIMALVDRLHADEAVIGGIGYTNFDLWGAGHRPQNFYMLGSMGLAVPIALGVALAQPSRRVIALEGDGSILMQLGALATVATLRPANLTIVVMDNGTYQITGGQPTATSTTADIAAIARGAGITDATWAADEADFATRIDAALASPDGPRLIACRITDAKPRATTERDPARIRDRFMRGLGVLKV